LLLKKELLFLLELLLTLLLIDIHRNVGCVLREFKNALEGLGNFGRDGRAVEESLNTFGKEGHVVLKASLDVSFGISVGERDEADFTGLSVDGGVGALVETLADVQEVIERVDIGPSAAASTSGGSGGVGLDVEEMLGEINLRAEDFDHLGDEFDIAFLGELAQEDTEGSGVADLEAARALVTEGGAVARAALPGDLAAVGIVGVRKNGFDRGEDRDEGGSLDVLGEGGIRGTLFLVVVVLDLLLLLFLEIQVIALFRSRTRADRVCRVCSLERSLLVVFVVGGRRLGLLFLLDGSEEGLSQRVLGVGKSLGHF
jgi:hypothetical protein